MGGGGRGTSGEEERRSAGAASGAAVEGAPLGRAATASGTTPHYTALCDAQQARRVIRPFGGCLVRRQLNSLPRQRLVFAGSFHHA